MEISGGSATHLSGSVAHTAERIGTFQRSADREAAEKEFAAMQPKQAPEHPWVAEAKAERAQKENARLERIRKGELVVHPDGSYTEKVPPRW